MTEAEQINKKNAKSRRELESAYEKTFATAHGKLVLADLRFSLPEIAKKSDPNEVYYDLGRRSVMIMIEQKLKDM